MTYINYECTICRRKKSILNDTKRVTPDQCIITKGCLGCLLPVNETQVISNTSSVAGLDDWYARGARRDSSNVEVDSVFTLSTSESASLVLAFASTNEAALPSHVTMTVEQKRIGEVEYQQFTFKLTTATTSVIGKDLNGKNLRFDQSAINENRITVKVNGVSLSAALTPNTITFATPLSVNDVVDVIVYATSASTTKTLTFTRNKTLVPSLTRGAWSNIDYIRRAKHGGGYSNLYLYSADSLSGLNAGKIRILGNSLDNSALFLLASTPYQSTDRYLNFFVQQTALSTGFDISNVDGALTASTDFLSEEYPPFELVTGAYISADLLIVDTSSAIITDTDLSRFASRKIIGPV